MLEAAFAATWPAAARQRLGRFVLQQSPGGGRRVTAAGLIGDGAGADEIDAAMARMRDWGQVPRFRVRADQARLDAALAARGLEVAAPSQILAAPVAALRAIEVPRLSAFEIWPPLAIMTEIWEDGGIGPDRCAVMARTAGARTALFGRLGDRPAAAAFLAASGPVAMLHALEVRPGLRRGGAGRRLVGYAARWAAGRGCRHLAVAVEAADADARAFYAALGMAETGRYHYRECQ
ncbi:MAG: GNAT family N-acetyltransferase [Rhodobacteraceae bacterium]|nr:GNAT family N-acetyltransferase [Paracoccaceae bacterium]